MDKFNKSFLRIKSAICEDINAKKKALIVEQACSINECGDAGLDINEEEEDCNCGKEDCPICNCKKEKEEEAENSEENEESAGNEQALS